MGFQRHRSTNTWHFGSCRIIFSANPRTLNRCRDSSIHNLCNQARPSRDLFSLLSQAYCRNCNYQLRSHSIPAARARDEGPAFWLRGPRGRVVSAPVPGPGKSRQTLTALGKQGLCGADFINLIMTRWINQTQKNECSTSNCNCLMK